MTMSHAGAGKHVKFRGAFKGKNLKLCECFLTHCTVKFLLFGLCKIH